jgi:hypothetical protein
VLKVIQVIVAMVRPIGPLSLSSWSRRYPQCANVEILHDRREVNRCLEWWRRAVARAVRRLEAEEGRWLV